ncbi:MAG: hypothetical protein K2Q22_12450 [Cytophagales bacterium]|nr:hypothetical protein [Cytophagales bacterium]
MQAFRFIETAENGELKITLPKEIENSRVEVIVLPIDSNFYENNLSSSLKKFKGDAPYPKTNTPKKDVYQQ